jgi:TrkA domain protein
MPIGNDGRGPEGHVGEVNETELPGVGIRFDFATREGQRLGVLVHRTGWREVFLYRSDDPDACAAQLRLDEDDARTLGELLGVSRIAEHLGTLHQEIEGLAMDWIRVEEGAAWTGLALADAQVHTLTGVSVVAIIRGETTIPAPRSSEVLMAGDVAVGVGTAAGIAQVEASLRRPAQRG